MKKEMSIVAHSAGYERELFKVVQNRNSGDLTVFVPHHTRLNDPDERARRAKYSVHFSPNSREHITLTHESLSENNSPVQTKYVVSAVKNPALFAPLCCYIWPRLAILAPARPKSGARFSKLALPPVHPWGQTLAGGLAIGHPETDWSFNPRRGVVYQRHYLGKFQLITFFQAFPYPALDLHHKIHPYSERPEEADSEEERRRRTLGMQGVSAGGHEGREGISETCKLLIDRAYIHYLRRGIPRISIQPWRAQMAALLAQRLERWAFQTSGAPI